MVYIIWLVLFCLFVFSFLNPNFSIWIPIVIYVVVVGVKMKEIIGNYKDEILKNRRDEERAVKVDPIGSKSGNIYLLICR